MAETIDTSVLLELPLDAWHRARAARMVPFAGYQMPVQYEGVIAEHVWTRTSAGLFDVSHMGQLTFHGDRVDTALETLMPGELQLLKDGRLRYSMLLDDEGGIIDDLMATRRGDHFYVVVNGATKHGDILEFERRLLKHIVLDHMKEQALLALQGPRAAKVLETLAPGVSELSFMQGGAFTIAGTPAWISRSGYTGEDGFEISVAASAAEAVADALTANDAVKPIGLGARDSLRLEAGLPLYGHDLDPEITPVMADLGFALSKRRREAADFPGAERILTQREHGPATKRVGLIVEGRQPAREGSEVIDDTGATIGRLTSGGFAPTLGKPIAMAYVPLALSMPGTRIEIAQRGKVHTATVTAMPFIPHRYVRAGAK